MPDNEFGYTGWGMDWVRVAEPLNQTKPEPLLPRARSIARNNGVRTLIEGNHLQANIHRGSEASVTYLEVTPLDGPTIRALEQVIPPTALTLTDEHRAAVAALGIPLTPHLARIDCSCRARNDRCLHFFATCYALARQVDETPWLALDLLGYRNATPGPETDETQPPARWTPINTLDPKTFFESVSR
ncbi:hypothetical protein ACWIGI_09540 [Nocardia sp. NPDC055321]